MTRRNNLERKIKFHNEAKAKRRLCVSAAATSCYLVLQPSVAQCTVAIFTEKKKKNNVPLPVDTRLPRAKRSRHATALISSDQHDPFSSGRRGSTPWQEWSTMKQSQTFLSNRPFRDDQLQTSRWSLWLHKKMLIITSWLCNHHRMNNSCRRLHNLIYIVIRNWTFR